MISNPSASFTRPADTTAYADADLIANSTTAGSVAALEFASVVSITGGRVRVLGARMTKSDDDPANASFKLHLFSANPVATAPSNGDNGSLQLNGARSNYLGAIALDLQAAAAEDIHADGNSGVGRPAVPILVKLPSGTTSIWGLLEALAAYAPASAEVFTVTLEVDGE